MPVGEYQDMAACIAAHQDKADPAAYCAAIEQAAKAFRIAKFDDAQNIVFGWASVAVGKDDGTLVDSQGDMIAPDVLEQAAYDFVLHARTANEMHTGEPIGQLIEAVMVTPEKLEAMGLMRKSAPQVGLWVGFKVAPAVYAKVKAGKLSMFSIEGSGDRVAA